MNLITAAVIVILSLASIFTWSLCKAAGRDTPKPKT
jgi:hypothetical protein